MNPAIPVLSDRHVDSSADMAAPENDTTLLYWLSLVLSHRRALLLAGLFGAVALVGYQIMKPRVYTATALAIMDNQTSSSTLSGLTASLGLTPLQSDGAPTPYFYADLATSDIVLGSVADSNYSYRSPNGVVRGNLIAAFRVAGINQGLRREHAIARLRKIVSARVTPKTGVVTVTATTENPELAALIVARVINEVNRVNILSRQDQAGGEREFTGRRVAEAEQELRTAENQLQDFLQRNRDYNSAPQTAFEEDRLARTVAMRQSIYTSVAQAYEQARIQESRDTPGLRIVAPATVPVAPNSRGLPQAAILGLLIGAFVAVCVGLWMDYLSETAERDPEQISVFRKAIRDTLRDIKHPWAIFRRRRET